MFSRPYFRKYLDLVRVGVDSHACVAFAEIGLDGMVSGSRGKKEQCNDDGNEGEEDGIGQDDDDDAG